MFFIYFLISFNYNVLRAYKDSMVVTASKSGAEAIPFIKVWAILPSALLLTFLFTRLANKFSKEKVFYIMFGIFLSFFFVFGFFLFPAQEYLHPHAFADRVQEMLPAGFKGFVAMFRNWTFTLFYVMSELWSTAIMSVLFWGFANEVTKVEEARRFYILWSIGANIAGIFAGQATIYLSDETNAWEQSVFFLSCALIVSGLLTLVIFRYLTRRVISSADTLGEHMEPKEKVKMSMRKNFAYLARSKYLICIALIVLCYNLGINLVEVVWKNQIQQLYPNPNDYNKYMGQVMTWMGAIATVISVFITGSVIRKLSWTTSALVTPITALIAGLGFFFFALFGGATGAGPSMFMGMSPLVLSVLLGSLHNCTTRACKYTLFDATKEISFIPLNSESRLKGKAAIDGVGSRLGKSGGSVIHQGLLILFCTISASTPYVAAIFFIVVLIWILSAIALGKQFDGLVHQAGKLNISDAPTPARAPVLSTTQS
jgi:AAA family ATP:ADP antiporter